MNVEVRLFATLRRGRFNRQVVDVPQGSTVTDVCRRLAIGLNEVAIVLVNGLEAPRERELVSGDTLSLFPGVGGG
jgi:molybdopterin converting factor small subunit